VAFLEGEMALAAGNASAAVQSFTMALTSAPEDLLIRVRLAEALHAAGQTSAAFDVLDEVLAEDPAYDAALVAAGDLHLEKGRIAEAESFYRRAIEAEPSSHEAYARLIALHRKAADPGAALAVALSLLEAEPHDEDALLAAAELSLEMNQTDDAFHYMSLYIAAVPVEPAASDRYGAVLNLAKKLLEKGESDRAVFLYRTYLALFPGDVEATAGLVRALVAEGDSIRARSLVDSMPDAPGDAADTLKLLKADLYLLAGSPTSALEALAAAFGALSPSLPARFKTAWVQALASASRFQEAEAALASFSAAEEGMRTAAACAIAAAMIRAWLYDDAWKLVASPGSDLEAHLSDRGLRTALRVLLIRCPDDALVSDVRKALTASPAGRMVLAEAYFLGTAEPDPVLLLDDLEGIREDGPADDVLVDAWVLEAVCVIEDVCKAKPTHVLSLTAKIADLSPADPRLPGLRGMFYLAAGNRERALISLEKANRTLPVDPLVKTWLAGLLAHDDAARARALLTSALLLAPPPYVLSAILAAPLPEP
jgi:tetratricopeptide (TPR) repeat protein